MAKKQHGAPWRIYLLIDPTTGPASHPLGTIFYVGLRSDLPTPVDFREMTEPQSLPQEEGAARERLTRLNEEGVRVHIEVLPEQWQESARTPGVPRLVDSLCAVLHPRPLNQRSNGVLWSRSLAETVERAEYVKLPSGGAIVRTHRATAPLAQLLVLDPDEAFTKQVEYVEGRTSPRANSNRLKNGGPLPLFLVASGHHESGVLPSGFVVAIWMVRAIEQVDEELWRVFRADDPEAEGALRREYLHKLIDTREGFKLRKN